MSIVSLAIDLPQYYEFPCIAINEQLTRPNATDSLTSGVRQLRVPSQPTFLSFY